MATIIAKLNVTGSVWNPLDPNNWQGGVVPGPNDIAQFYRYGTNAAYEYNYQTYQHYSFDPNGNVSHRIYPSAFTNNKYTSSFWSTDYKRELTMATWSGSWTQGSSFPYGAASPNYYYHPGLYYNQQSLSVIGSKLAYTDTSQDQWDWYYKDKIYRTHGDRGQYYYRLFGMTYFCPYYGNQNSTTNRSNTSLTVDGVTIAEPLGLNGEAYASASRPYGISKAQWAAQGRTYTMADRMVDLFTGSALHVDNGGKYKIYGPHNGRGITDTAAGLNKLQYFTIIPTASLENWTGPLWGTASITYNNAQKYDQSTYLRRKAHLAISRSTMEPQDLIDEEYPILVWEGTQSIIDRGITDSADWNNTPYVTGSGTLYIPTYNGGVYQGIGPQNQNIIKVTFKDPIYAMYLYPEIDRTYCNWVDSESLEMPLVPPENSGYVTNDILYNNNVYNNKRMQQWELTGSQHWHVGRIEMGYWQHFRIKDSATITLYDLESGTSYPTIEMQDAGVQSTLIIQDTATINISSSRSTSPAESGIWNYRSGTTLIISGSPNYSSSVLASAANTGDSTIEITDLTSSFGIGDYITIQSTGSLKVTNDAKDHGLAYIDQNDSGSWYSASMDDWRGRHGVVTQNTLNYLPNPHSGSYFRGEAAPIVTTEFTHTVETDEIVQIMTMSGDYVTVGKMYGKEGEIQSDMGMYSYNGFAETFTDVPNTRFYGDKRVVLVDSNHLNYKTDDILVISGSVYKVLHATSYLSQSNFYEFTSSNQPALSDVFDLNPDDFRGISIWPTSSNAYGVNVPTLYYQEMFLKSRLLITGSYNGSLFWTGSGGIGASYVNHGYTTVYLSSYGGKSGSNNDYRSLQLDPTQCYTWTNFANENSDWAYRNNPAQAYKTHDVWTTSYLSGTYQLKDTSNFREGEITVSGSIMRNGLFDPTSSVAYDYRSNFGFLYGETPFVGVSRQYWDTYDKYYSYGYNRPSPYTIGFTFTGRYGPKVAMTGNIYGTSMPLFKREVERADRSGGVLGTSGSIDLAGMMLSRANTNFDGAPANYITRMGGLGIYSDPIMSGSSFDLSSVVNNWTGSGGILGSTITTLSSSLYAQQAEGITGGSAHMRMTLQDGVGELFVGDAKGNELFCNRFIGDKGRGRVSLKLTQFASIHSVNIKTRWQQLILDTADSFNYRDKIKEGGLLYDHYAGKENKFIATEVVDAKGFKNLLWDYEYKKGDTDILPYMFASCDYGATAGHTTLNHLDGRVDLLTLNPDACVKPGAPGYHYWHKYQANDNFYIIYDFRTPVTFDTVGMTFCKDGNTWETNVDNQMNDVTFWVCDDATVDNPSWEEVRTTYDDTRRATYRGGIRFYTFPDGSVSKRYVKYRSRGGTKSTAYAMHGFFGVYDFSGSCAASDTLPAASIAGGFADEYGGPTGSMLQIELANTKNFGVGDMIYFWSKQMNSSGRLQNQDELVPGYINYNGVTGAINGSTPEKEMIGGFWPIYTITDISGNHITVNKPITHDHIGEGTMAYKYNRGKLTLSGSRNCPFYVYPYTSTNYVHISDTTFINGNFYSYNGSGVKSHRVMEDVGAMTYQESSARPLQPGLFRNIITPGLYPDGYSTTWDDLPEQKCFNLTQTYGNAVGGIGQMRMSSGKQVFNFCVNGGYTGGYNTRIHANTYAFGNNNGKKYYLNNWVRSDLYQDQTSGGGVSFIAGQGSSTHNVEHLIEANNTVSNTRGVTNRWSGRSTYGYTTGINQVKNDLKRHSNNIRSNTFYFPSATNPRLRGTSYNESVSAGSPIGGSLPANWSYYPGGQVPVLKKGFADPLFGNKDYIILRSNQYFGFMLTQSPTFNNDKLYDMYTFGGVANSNLNSYTTAPSEALGCEFHVNENDVDIRLDLDFTYKNLLWNVYGGTAGYSNYGAQSFNNFGEGHPCFLLYNIDTRKIYYTKYLDQCSSTTLNIREQLSLPAGTYCFILNIRGNYYTNYQNLVLSFKDLKFNVVTSDLSKVKIVQNNFDVLTLFDNEDHYVTGPSEPFIESRGKNSVLKQTSDLTKTYKFNKIKL